MYISWNYCEYKAENYVNFSYKKLTWYQSPCHSFTLSKHQIETRTTTDTSTDMEEDNHVKRSAIKNDAYNVMSCGGLCLIITQIQLKDNNYGVGRFERMVLSPEWTKKI